MIRGNDAITHWILMAGWMVLASGCSGSSSSPMVTADPTSGSPTDQPATTISPLPTATGTPTSTPTVTPAPAATSLPTVTPTASPIPVSTPTATPTPLPPVSDSFAMQVVALVNAERGKQGLDPLEVNPQLMTAAQSHAADMATQDYFSHIGEDGSTVADRVNGAGYAWTALGENIAAGSATPAVVMQQWMNSSGHRTNILNPAFQQIGVGYIFLQNDSGSLTYQHYWVQVFGRP